MKIKAVASGKDKKVPRGTPVEFSPEEKIPLAVVDAVKAYDFGDLIPHAAKKDVTVTKRSISPRVLATRTKPFQSNSYTAEGSVKVWFRDRVKDQMKPAKTYTFKIQFEDCCDELGMPDLKVLSFALS